MSFALYALKARGMPMRELAAGQGLSARTFCMCLASRRSTSSVNVPSRYSSSFPMPNWRPSACRHRILPRLAAAEHRHTGGFDRHPGPGFIRLDGAYDSVQAIADTPIVANGRTLKLSDIAEVRRGYEDPPTYVIRHQGEPTIMLAAVMQEGWNGLELGKALEGGSAAIAQTPLGMTLDKVTDQAVNITSAVDEFMMKFAMALGGAAGEPAQPGWRVGIVVAAAVPLTLAVVFLIMLETDQFFDRITLGALILALVFWTTPSSPSR